MKFNLQSYQKWVEMKLYQAHILLIDCGFLCIYGIFHDAEIVQNAIK